MYFVLHAEEMAERDNNGMKNDMILIYYQLRELKGQKTGSI